jgi:hypothetical protein
LLTVSVDRLDGQVILRWIEFEQYTVFFRNCSKRIHSEYEEKKKFFSFICGVNDPVITLEFQISSQVFQKNYGALAD